MLATSGDSGSEPQELVTLPLRFTQMINYTDCEKQRIGDNLSDREKDIHTALKWIRQEIVSIGRNGIVSAANLKLTHKLQTDFVI